MTPRELPRSIFRVLAESAPTGPTARPDDWREWLTGVIVDVWPTRWRVGLGGLDGLIERVGEHDQRLEADLDSRITELECAALGFGGLLGYALARTQPADFRAMDAWLGEAIEYADLVGWLAAERERNTRDT